jgi:hypothetical protein
MGSIPWLTFYPYDGDIVNMSKMMVPWRENAKEIHQIDEKLFAIFLHMIFPHSIHIATLIEWS